MVKVDLSEFKFKHCDHCRFNHTEEGGPNGCPYCISCIVDNVPGYIPSHFEGKTKMDTKYANLLKEYVKILKNLGLEVKF